MKSCVVKNFGSKVEVQEVPVPEPGENEVLVHIKCCGLCHTDIHSAAGDWSVKAKLPLCPGHEGVGYVVKVGSNVNNLREGDYVGVPWLNSACEKCEYCQSGWETLCPEQKNTGFNIPGCFRQYTTIAANFAVRIPPEISPEHAAPLLCAGVTAYKALKESEASPGQTVCIIGAGGGLGHLAVQYSNAMGFRTIAVEMGQEKVDYVRSLGVEHCFDACVGNADITEQILQLTGGGVHSAIVIAAAPGAYELAVDICRPKSVIVCVSLPGDSRVPIDIVRVVLRRLTLRGSIVGTRQDMIEALEYARTKQVQCRVNVDRIENINQDMKEILDMHVLGRTVLTW